MKKSFLVLGAIMFAFLFAGCKGAEEESGNALQDAILELCEKIDDKDNKAKAIAITNKIFETESGSSSDASWEISDTIRIKNHEVLTISLEDSKVKLSFTGVKSRYCEKIYYYGVDGDYEWLDFYSSSNEIFSIGYNKGKLINSYIHSYGL